jgi:hypothetical protein
MWFDRRHGALLREPAFVAMRTLHLAIVDGL